MTAVTFGDFLDQATGHLDAALAGWDQDTAHPTAAARQLHRLVGVMARHMDDITPWDETEALSRTDLTLWQHAAVDVTTALHLAADSLQHGLESHPDDGFAATAPARHLGDVATALIAGRDLLETHHALSPDGLTQERTEWGRVTGSALIAKTITGQLTRWSERLAPWTAELALHLLDDLGGEVFTAARWLRTAGAAARSAQRADPVSADELTLLRAIPSAAPPARQAPAAGEKPEQLCQGITLSAARLQAASRDTARRAQWSPSVTAGAWQWTATAGAITSHLSENLLRSLARRAAQLGLPAADAIHAAADTMAGARAAWHQVATTWDQITTETRFLASPAVAEAGDLVLRLGRLTWDDPAWTPAVHRVTQPRPAPADVSAIMTMVAAVHRSACAYAQVAAADLSAVHAADRAGRLYVPTRTLPDSYDIPRPYATAPAQRTSVLIGAYRVAVYASDQAASALDRVVLAADAPSRPLALARAAAAWPQDSGPPGQPVHTGGAPAGHRTAAEPAGPIEAAMRRLGIRDAGLLLRAAAVDKAGRSLIAQAQLTAGQPDQRPEQGYSRAAGPAQLAAASFPKGPLMGLRSPAPTAPRHPGVPGQVPRSTPARPRQGDTGKRV